MDLENTRDSALHGLLRPMMEQLKRSYLKQMSYYILLGQGFMF